MTASDIGAALSTRLAKALLNARHQQPLQLVGKVFDTHSGEHRVHLGTRPDEGAVRHLGVEYVTDVRDERTQDDPI